MAEPVAWDPSPAFNYDLPSTDMLTLTSELMARMNAAVENRVVCYRISGRSKFANIGRTIEREVFQEAFPGNDAAFMVREYGPYEGASTFFLSVDRIAGVAVGVLRVIGASPAGLKTLNDLARPESPLPLTAEQVKRDHRIDAFTNVWDVGTAAILTQYRRTGASVSLQLYRGMYVSALEAGIDHLIAVVDKLPLLAMTEYLGIPFVPLCGSDYFSYLGSVESRAVYGYVPGFHSAVSRRLAKVGDDPVAVRALRTIRDGLHDQALLFACDYKN